MTYLLVKLSQASVLIPLIWGISKYKYIADYQKVLFLLLLVAVPFEIQASLFKKVYHNNMPGLHLYTVVEFVLTSIIFIKYFVFKKSMRNLITVNMLLLILLALLDGTVFNGIWHSNTYARTYASISLLIYALYYFHYTLQATLAQEPAIKQPMFWIAIGILVYYSINILYFMLNNYLVSYHYYIAHSSMKVHALLNIILHLLFAKSFQCTKKLP
jgi:hypothetical protein